ncbi:High-affinity glucose transporter [Diplodia seriata]|uniref:High-affinity glucose transporter n=1 Tax=Diplodia seriata TaxID=420778 RepID=A0A1S8BGJ4_9PEZI|nr:High-affinity glucose transporter [Diplodia seriata]
MDRFGRKGTIIIGATVACVGAILQCAAMHLAMMLVGRILAGWAVGILSMSVPVYQSECAHPAKRGKDIPVGLIVGIAQQMIGVGFIVSTWIGYGSHHVPSTSSFSWRFPLAFQAIPCVLLMCGMPFFPESPRHLLETDRDEEAMRVLRKLHYNGENDEWINREFHEIKTTIAAEKAITAPLVNIHGCCRFHLLTSAIQWLAHHVHRQAMENPSYARHSCAGLHSDDWVCRVNRESRNESKANARQSINVINYYQTLMYENLGIEGSRNLLVTGIYNCVGPLCSMCRSALHDIGDILTAFTDLIFITFFLDRFGRKKVRE